MTKAEREQYRPAFDAWVDGELEWDTGNGFVPYGDSGRLLLSKRPEQYRRKPKLVECWGVETKDRKVYSQDTLEDAQMAQIALGGRVVRMREVVE